MNKTADEYMEFLKAEEERKRDYKEFYKTRYEFAAVFGEQGLDQVNMDQELAKKNNKEATSILKGYMNAVEPADVLEQARNLEVADEKIENVEGMEGSKEEQRAAAIALVVEKVRQMDEGIESAGEPKKGGGKRIKSKKRKYKKRKSHKRKYKKRKSRRRSKRR